MRLDKVQQNYWLSRTAASFSSAVKWTAEEVGCALSKTATAWERTPKVLKLPLAAAFLDFQRLKNWKNVAAGAFLMTEVPKVTAAFFCNYPIQWFGNRFQLFSVSLPDDPKTSLTDLDIKIGMFERAQPHLAASFAQTKPIKKPPILPQTPLAVMEKNTNRNLEVLSGKIAYLSILQVLHAYSGLPESDSPSLLNLVDDASRMSKPSLWRLFISHYGSKISWWGRLKAAVFYAFTWSWIPIIPKTVDAYLKTMLKELRANLKEDVEKRNKFINGLLEDADTFFEIYNGAVETYANDGARKGKLSHYQNNAVQLMFVKDGSDLRTQSPASFRMDLSRKISASIVDHFGPKVSFGFGFLDRLLNYLIKFTLREKILPQVFLNITNEGKEAAKSNIPFSIALTKTLITQISKLQGDLQQGDSDTSSLAGIGIKGFEPIVKKFLWSLDIAECKTVEEIRLKIEQLKRPENDINAEVRKKIQMGIQTGLAAIFDYLSKQENTEELFATFFDSVSAPLSGHVPITEKQWIEMATEYEGTKILLKQAGSSLCKQIVQTAVQDAVRGGSNPAAIQKSAQKILSEHKFRGMEVFEELCQIGKTIEKKINQSKDFVGTENDILKELEAMTSILKAFENTERVKITLDQDPPPKIAALPNAEREAILRVLYPLYEGSNKTMDAILNLQNIQQRYSFDAKKLDIFRRIQQTLIEIPYRPLKDAILLFKQISASLRDLEQSDPAKKQTMIVTQQISRIHPLLENAMKNQKALHALAALYSVENKLNAGLVKDLIDYVHKNSTLSFKKRQYIEQIKENITLAGFSHQDQEELSQLIETINKYNSLPKPRPNFNVAIWKPITLLLLKQKTHLEKMQRHFTIQTEEIMAQIDQSLALEEKEAGRTKLKTWKEMQKTGSILNTNLSKLHHFIHNAQKELQTHLSDAQFGQVLGFFSFLIGFGIEASPITDSYKKPIGTAITVLGALFASIVSNLGKFTGGKWLTASVAVLSSGSIAGGIAHATPTITKPFESLHPMIEFTTRYFKAMLASASFEYAGSKFMSGLIKAGVDVSMPKVTEIFDKAYEHLFTNDTVINGAIKIFMNQMILLFPPKTTQQLDLRL